MNAHPGHVHRWIAAFTLLIAACCVFYKARQFQSFGVRDFDAGIYSNIAWNVAHGRGLWSDVLNRHALAEHFSPIVALFAPIYWWWPSALVLLTAQAIAVALTFPLLAGVARHIFIQMPSRRAVALTATSLALFMLYRPVFAALDCEFHPCTLGMPLVAAALWSLHARRIGWLVPIVSLLLCTKEMAALSVIGLGLYALAVLRNRRAGPVLIAVGVIAGLVIMLIVLPHFRGETWRHYQRLGPLTDPGEKAWYILRLLAGVGFLPLLSWRAAIATVPLAALNLLVSMPNQYSLKFHYDDQNSVLLIVAAMHGMRTLALLGDRPERRTHQLAWLAGGIALVAAVSVNGIRPLQAFRRLCLRPLPPEILQLQRELEPWLATSPSVGVAAVGQLGPHLNLRWRYERVAGNAQAVIALERSLQRGDLVIVSPVELAPGVDWQRLDRMLNESEAFRPLHRSKVLQVFVRIDDTMR